MPPANFLPWRSKIRQENCLFNLYKHTNVTNNDSEVFLNDQTYKTKRVIKVVFSLRLKLFFCLHIQRSWRKFRCFTACARTYLNALAWKYDKFFVTIFFSSITDNCQGSTKKFLTCWYKVFSNAHFNLQSYRSFGWSFFLKDHPNESLPLLSQIILLVTELYMIACDDWVAKKGPRQQRNRPVRDADVFFVFFWVMQ